MEPHRWKPHWNHESIDETRCRASTTGGLQAGSFQCSRETKPGSEWCWQHDPERIAKQQAEREDLYNRIRREAAEVAERSRRQPYDECIEILRSIGTDLMDPDADEFRRIAIALIERRRDDGEV